MKEFVALNDQPSRFGVLGVGRLWYTACVNDYLPRSNHIADQASGIIIRPRPTTK